MDVMLIALLIIAAVGLLIVGFVAYPDRGRAVPKVERLSEALVAVTEKVDPGPAPVHGVLSTPAKSRRMSRRFENAEAMLRHPTRMLTSSGR
jgi:hypothetical protein